MKCSPRRNCDRSHQVWIAAAWCLNEVQFPKELRPLAAMGGASALALPQ